MGHDAQETDAAAAVDFKEVQSTEQFQELRKRHRSFVFPLSIAFLLWYFAYVLLADYAVGFMSIKVWGNINVGLILGLLQFVSTFAITGWYVSYSQPQAGPHCLRDPPGNRRARIRQARQPGRGDSKMTLMVPAVNVADLKDTTLLNIGIFALFVAVTMVIVIRASRNNKTAADYYAAGRSFTGPQNGIAIAGDYLSAASFLGITGAIAINGYDGFLYSIGFLVAWLVALLLVAELLRNTGKFTMADVLSFRLKQRPVRIAAAITTLAVCFFYLLAQMAGAGGLVSLLLGISDWVGQSLVIVVVGVLMIIYVLIGGMKGTTWVQIIKALLLIAGAAVMTFWVLAINGFNLSDLLGGAVETLGQPGPPQPGPAVRQDRDPARLHVARPGAGARHRGPAARADALLHGSDRQGGPQVGGVGHLAIGIFYLFTLVLGYGAAALVGADTIKAAPGGVNSAAPLLAFHLGGPLLLGFISAVAFATILAVVAGLTITAAASFAHDIYANVIARGKADAGRRGQGRPPHRGRDRRCWRSSAASAPTGRTSRSSWRSPSPWRPRPTCRPSSTRCSGAGSPPGARCGACTADSLRPSS